MIYHEIDETLADYPEIGQIVYDHAFSESNVKSEIVDNSYYDFNGFVSIRHIDGPFSKITIRNRVYENLIKGIFK